MRATSLVAVVSAVWLAHRCSDVAASEQLVADDLCVVKTKADALAKRFDGPGHVLIVFDIDNTLLASEQNFGSDQWFNWQAALLEHAPDSNYMVAEDIESLVRLWSEIVKHGKTRLTQDSGPATIDALGSEGFSLLILSARPRELHDVTRRHLRAHGIDVSRRALELRAHAGATIDPAEGIAIDVEFTASERIRLHIGSFSTLHFSDGMCLCSGQNKGAILRLLLRRATAEIKAVLFVDDDERNTNAVFDALRDTKTDVTTVRFSREDKRVHDFLHGDKQRVHRQWRRFHREQMKDPAWRLIEAVVPESDGRPLLKSLP